MEETRHPPEPDEPTPKYCSLSHSWYRTSSSKLTGTVICSFPGEDVEEGESQGDRAVQRWAGLLRRLSLLDKGSTHQPAVSLLILPLPGYRPPAPCKPGQVPDRRRAGPGALSLLPGRQKSILPLLLLTLRHVNLRVQVCVIPKLPLQVPTASCELH